MASSLNAVLLGCIGFVVYLNWISYRAGMMYSTSKLTVWLETPDNLNREDQRTSRSVLLKRKRKRDKSKMTTSEEPEESAMEFLKPFVRTIPPVSGHNVIAEEVPKKRMLQEPAHGLRWTPLDHDLYGVSAFLDHFSFNKPVVLVNVAADKSWFYSIKKMYCVYKNVHIKGSEFLGRLILRKSEEEQRLRTGWLMCPILKNQVPDSVLIRISQQTSDSIKVHTKQPSLVGNLNICCTTILSKTSSASSIIEYVEMYKLVGADHVSFYTSIKGEELKKLQEYYNETADASFIPVRLSNGSSCPEELQYELIKNDCIMSSSRRYRYTAVTKINEFILPESNLKLLPVVQSISQNSGSLYKLPVVVFCTNFPANESIHRFLHNARSNSSSSLHLKTQLHTYSSNQPCPNSTIYRILLKTETFTIEQINNKGGLSVRPDKARVHQYSQCPDQHKQLAEQFHPCKFFPYPKVDRTAHKYLYQLSTNVQRVYQRLFQKGVDLKNSKVL